MTERTGAVARARLVLAGFGWRVFVRRYRWQLAVSILVIALVGSLAVIAVLATEGSGGSSPAPAVALEPFSAPLPAVPTNHVTGSGTATVQLLGTTATISLITNGLLAGAPHLAHIHGEGLGTCPTATNARLHNGHLSISTGDAIKLYGPTLLSFTEWGSTSGSVPNNIDMNRYPASGNIRYRRVMTVPKLVADLIRDGNAVIVVHGIDYNYNHIYDFQALGVSDLDRTLPGEATAPALCGTLHPAPQSHSATAATGTTYVASLSPAPSPSATSGVAVDLAGDRPANWARLSEVALLCHLTPS